MKNLKRIFSLALAGTMLAGMLTVGASAADFTDADSIKNNEAVDTMVALNIINGKDDGSFAPEATVTRAEMAKMITIMLNGGSEPALTASASNAKFTDIGGHWAQKYIEYCVSQNVIAGRGDGTFAPDATVTGTEAAKMALTALGYNSEVFNFTGIDWEVNVNAAANAPSANLYEGLRNINPGEGLSRDNAAQMLYNALDANVVEISYNITSNGVETGYVISDKKTMMTERFGAVKVVGIITSNEIATIGADTAEDKGETVIKLINEDDVKTFGSDSMTLKVSTDASVLGRTVSAYVKSNAKASGADVMGSVVLTNDDKVVTNTSGKDLAELAKDNKLTIPASVKAGKDYTATEADPAAGDTTIMIDNNGDKKVDYIFVVTYQVAQISKIDTKNEKVTFKGLAGVTRVDFEDVIDYEDFEEDDYVLVNTFGGNYYLTAPETVEGELTEYKVNDDSEATKLTIDSTTYDVSAVEVNATTELTSAKTLGEANLETEAVFYLDANGKIVAMGEAKEAAAQYAISWGGASGNKIDNNRIKLTLEDGTTAVYTVDSKSDVKIGGDNGSEFSGKGITDANKNAVGALIAYTIKSNGNVSLKAVENTASKSAAFEKGKTLIDNVSATANTLFFHVETVGGTGDDKNDVKEVEVFTGYKNAPSTEKGTILVATNAKTGKAVAAVFIDPVTNSGKAKVADHLWLKSTGTSNKDYTNATVVLAGGEEADIKIAAGETFSTKNFYLFTINSDGYYELDKASEDKDAANFYNAGTVYSISSDTVVIGVDEANVTEYYTTKNTVEVDATKDGASIEKNATVEVIFDKESEEVLMIVVTKAAP